MNRFGVLVAVLLGAGSIVHAAQWELSRPGSATIIHPLIHDTEFRGTNIGCVTLSRSEMRRFGYPGHALFCEEASTGEVLGAVLNRRGRELCEIRGFYNNDAACYDLTICEESNRLCKRQ